MLTVLFFAVAIALMVILPFILFYYSPEIAALENERRELRSDLYGLYFQSRVDQIVKGKRPPIALHSEYGKSLYWNKDIISRVEALKMKQDISDAVERLGIKEPKGQVEPDPLPHPFLPSMKNPPPPPAKKPDTITADELVSSINNLLNILENKRPEPKGDYTRGGIVSGKDLFDALHRDKPETIVPPNKIKEILSESIGIKPGELVINALNEKYTFAQVARGWVAPGEYTKRSGGWIFAATSPAYKIMIPRTTGKTIADISSAVGDYGQNN